MRRGPSRGRGPCERRRAGWAVARSCRERSSRARAGACHGALVALALLLAAAPARAGHVTDLATTFDDSGVVNADLQVSYLRSLKRGAIKREFAGLSTYELPLVKDLRFSQVQHILDLRAGFTLLKALRLYLALPIVLADTRSLEFAQNGGDPCGTPTETNCVTPLNSTLVRDGLINGSGMAANQVAVAGETQPQGGLLLPTRSGLDQMVIGLSGAPLSQQRDPTKPTWVIGFEARIGVGGNMEYDPLRPTANTSVGTGVHEFLWYTSVSRRYKYFDPWMSIFYMLPATRGGSLYEKTTFALSGQERQTPQQRGGGEIGVEIIPYDRPEKQQRITLELSLRMEGVFEGRGYSELWEVLAGNKQLEGPCQVPGAYDVRPWQNGVYCSDPAAGSIAYPGITSIENYAIYRGTFGVNVEMTRYFRARLGVSLAHEGDHFITFGDAGRSLNNTGIIDPRDERQVNPMYRPMVDSPGRRIRVSETTLFDVFISMQGQF